MRNKYVFTAVLLCAVLAVSMGLTNLYVRYGDKTKDQDSFRVLTSFYPMYVAVANIVSDVPGVTLENLSEPQTGCLHDFQLTPEDMKRLASADVFVINGGGIESFMQDVGKAYPSLAVIEACAYTELLSDGGETNPHAWMSIAMYRELVQTIAYELAEADEANAVRYRENADVYDAKLAALQERQEAIARAAQGTKVILFHEAWDYIAYDYGMQVQYVMDLDEERQVSAGEVADVLAAVEQDGVSLILAEELYGRAMAETVQQETPVSVVYLDPLNRGEYDADSYLEGMGRNLDLLEGYFLR